MAAERREACVQCALLYTAGDGTRRIRVHTRPLRIVREASQLLRAVHPPSLIALQAKLACDDLGRVAAKQVGEAAEAACAKYAEWSLSGAEWS